jgi:hypothetical protein
VARGRFAGLRVESVALSPPEQPIVRVRAGSWRRGLVEHLAKIASVSLLGLAVGCSFNLQAIPVDGLRDAGPSARDAGDGDGAVRDASSHDDAASPPGPKHAGCSAALSPSEPEPGGIAVDVKGRPLFDTYRDIACADTTEVKSCFDSDKTACPIKTTSGHCLSLSPSSVGVCTSDSLIQETQLTFDRGRCTATLQLDTAAAACCRGLKGFDCRGAWPYPHDGEHGQLCARHADCQAGLACRQSFGSGFGRCVCPEEKEIGSEPCF